MKTTAGHPYTIPEQINETRACKTTAANGVGSPNLLTSSEPHKPRSATYVVVETVGVVGSVAGGSVFELKRQVVSFHWPKYAVLQRTLY